MGTKIEKKKTAGPFGPLVERLSAATPQKDLFEVVFENPNLEVFTFWPEAEGLDKTHVVDDPLGEAIRYVLNKKAAAITITRKFYSIIKPGADCMAAMKLHSAIRQDKWIKDRTNGN